MWWSYTEYLHGTPTVAGVAALKPGSATVGGLWAHGNWQDTWRYNGGGWTRIYDTWHGMQWRFGGYS